MARVKENIPVKLGGLNEEGTTTLQLTRWKDSLLERPMLVSRGPLCKCSFRLSELLLASMEVSSISGGVADSAVLTEVVGENVEERGLSEETDSLSNDASKIDVWASGYVGDRQGPIVQCSTTRRQCALPDSLHIHPRARLRRSMSSSLSRRALTSRRSSWCFRSRRILSLLSRSRRTLATSSSALHIVAYGDT